MQLGGRVYPVRHYPIAIRLRDREGRAILCIALYPRTGESSGAILGVRSVALLHAQSQQIDGAGASLEDGALHLQFRGRAGGATGHFAVDRAEPYRLEARGDD